MAHQDNCSGVDEYPGTAHPFNAAWKIQRLYIDALWTLPPSGRQRFLEVRSVQTLLRVVRSITALNQLARANQGDSFQQQCRACLNTATSVLSSQDLESVVFLAPVASNTLVSTTPSPNRWVLCDASVRCQRHRGTDQGGTRTRGRWTKAVATFCSRGC